MHEYIPGGDVIIPLKHCPNAKIIKQMLVLAKILIKKADLNQQVTPEEKAETIKVSCKDFSVPVSFPESCSLFQGFEIDAFYALQG
ncbi:MAG: hypothetical protein ACOYOS_16300 [Syntrophales bacterium]